MLPTAAHGAAKGSRPRLHDGIKMTSALPIYQKGLDPTNIAYEISRSSEALLNERCSRFCLGHGVNI